MLNQLKSLTERVGGSNELVDRWLAARNHLLVTYYKMVGIKPGKEPMTALDEQALDDFCHCLVDYLSAGHFNIYERVISEMEGTSPLVAATQIYPQLESNTQQIMDFYDTHLESAIDHDNCLEFQEALSGIGEALAARFALEDKLILLAFDNNLGESANDETGLAKPA
ncbi:sigma D regulator [Cronobacter sakazakii]|uniref:sigma D regulator n=1 Tax=Cronobacter sakazakii TaxID=28141 RepID=UPI000CFAC43A|nr:sigma D regulator [Cronobacter sakazakii]ELY4860138.1 sigma D regulator [Cronobacter sakazakii]NCH16516.1 sigma D regulator [Cronobacter sakazakii]